MTFDEASKLIKKSDIIRLRKELQDGLSPNTANQYSWTLLMVAALEGNTSIGSLLHLSIRQSSFFRLFSMRFDIGIGPIAFLALPRVSFPKFIFFFRMLVGPRRIELRLPA